MKTILGSTLFAIAAAASLAFAAGGGSMSTPAPSGGANESAENPMLAAKRLHNDGVKRIEKAEALAAGDKKRDSHFSAALKKFEAAVEKDPALAEAWNYIGYSRRQLGDAAGALGAYDEALRLQPQYPQALEYRGQAYLKLGKLDEAKQDYLALFAKDRALATQLLAAMKTWAGAQRASGGDQTQLDALDTWIAERERAATQTAAMSRVGSAAGWQ
jgi:tetratricopeptide (TPR) repeat protein